MSSKRLTKAVQVKSKRKLEKERKDDEIMTKVNENAGARFLAKGVEVSNDSHKTFLNLNDCIIGSSGSGKSTSYVHGNLAGMYSSYIIADTKGNLAKKFGPKFRKSGYDVKVVDLIDLEKSVGYNPMDRIRRYDDGKYNEQDVQTLAALLCPVKSVKDPYWEDSARNLICALIALVIETESPENQDLTTVGKYAADLGFLLCDKQGKIVNNAMGRLHTAFETALRKDPQSFAWKKYQRFADLQESEKTWICIINVVEKIMTTYDLIAYEKMFTNSNKIDLTKPGREKCAYFINVSDVDRSNDDIANILYSQIFQALIQEADNNPDSRLQVPVRFILDDFATNIFIPDFDKIISVIRSREISVSIILQSITQLNSLYGPDRARTIINNCDHLVYLGGHDIDTCKYISQIANKPLENIVDMPLDHQYILTRGQKPVYAERLAPDTMNFDDVEPVIQENDPPAHKKIVLKDIPRSLLLLNEHDKKSYKFSYAYSIDARDVVYGVIILPAKDIIFDKSNDKRCSINLGYPDKMYTCRISSGGKNVSLTAGEIDKLYRRNKQRYLDYIKLREKEPTTQPN